LYFIVEPDVEHPNKILISIGKYKNGEHHKFADKLYRSDSDVQWQKLQSPKGGAIVKLQERK